MFCIQDTLLKYKDTDRLKVKVWKQIRHANSKHKIDTLASINNQTTLHDESYWRQRGTLHNGRVSTPEDVVMRMPLKTQLPATWGEACEARAKRRNGKPLVTSGDCSCLSITDGTIGHNM